tara:strand:+ start:1526 stop:2020 length:495 start_codon:yes stop_codon:yes gene_type:complete
MTDSITVSFAIPTAFVVTKRNGAEVSCDMSKLPVEQVRELFLYGLGQKVRDSSSSFPDKGGSITAMNKCLAALYENQWAIRATATGDPLDPYRVTIIREALAKPRNKEANAIYLAIPSDDQKARRAFLLSIAAQNSHDVDIEAKRRLAVDEADSAAISGLTIAI